MPEVQTGVGQQTPAKTEKQFVLSNTLGIASTFLSVALLGATGYFLFRRERPEKWYLYLAAGKIGLDLAQAAWVMALVRKGTPKPAIAESIEGSI